MRWRRELSVDLRAWWTGRSINSRAGCKALDLTTQSSAAEAPAAQPRIPWWLALLACLPFAFWYGVARLLAWIAGRIDYRGQVVRPSLALAFPELDEPRLRQVARNFYHGYAQVFAETIKSARLTPDDLRGHVRFQGLEPLRATLAGGRPAIVLAAHQCNWEWLLLALCGALDYPVDAAYKPLVNGWADRAMTALRSRFGARLVPAQQLLGDILQRRKLPRVIAINADQEPVQSDNKHWLRFLNRDSAFYTGPEEIARATRYPVWFLSMRREERGQYVVEALPLWDAQEKLAPGEFTARYAALVEKQIRAAPADWPWSHKRWRLQRSLYG
jgi:KDO2-lipid IV(A) lauroyltransferase